MPNTVSIDALRPELWEKALFADVMDNLWFAKKGIMGEGEDNIIQIKNDLKRQKGDTITVGLTAKLTGNGVSGDNELEGNEETITPYSESISIDQKRFGVRLTGKLDEQKNAYNMRTDAKNKLKIRLKEFIEMQMFLKLAGVNITTLTNTAGTVTSADALWSNTPMAAGDITIRDTATAAGYGDRYLCADYTNGADSLASTDLLTPELISRVKTKAQTASPKILPVDIDGANHYVLIIHPWQAFDLKTNAVWMQAQREASWRGSKNPIFTGALGVWDGVVVMEHEYVPWLDISVVGNNFMRAASGTDISADCCRALLLGKQAAIFAKCNNENGWVEETFDYKNKTGFATGIIGGIQKTMFNSKEYGVVALDTAVTALV